MRLDFRDVQLPLFGRIFSRDEVTKKSVRDWVEREACVHFGSIYNYDSIYRRIRVSLRKKWKEEVSKN